MWQLHRQSYQRFCRTAQQCTLKHGASIKDLSIRATGFRGRFGAAVVAVKRNKKRVEGRIGDVVLQPHDQLLLDTGLWQAAGVHFGR